MSYDPQTLITALARDHLWFSTFAIALGSLSLARLAYQTLSVVAQTFLRSGTSLNKFGAKRHAWAVVTGATDGIGKEFALQLAKAGFSILLVARNQGLLTATEEEIAKTYNVPTASVSIDFSKDDKDAFAGLAKAVEGLDVGVLVNNVGKSHAMPAYLVDTPKDEINDILKININGTVNVTYLILPGMVKRKSGLIINVGSFAGAIPSPMLAAYSGSKAFLATFTSALAEEVKAHNITVEHLNTYFVVSKLSKIRKSSALIPQPKAYVRSVLSKIGLACGAAYSGRPNTSTPFWSHALLDYAITLIGIKSLFISYTHGLHKDIRRRALKKIERDAAQVDKRK